MKKILLLAMTAAIIFTLAVTTSAAGIPGDYLAHLTFDSADAIADGDIDLVINNIAADGSAQVVLEEGHNGTAATFDDTDDTTKYWFELKKADGTSLLAGLNEVTISWWSKSDLVGPNWAFFAARNIDGAPIVPTYLNEKYIGGVEWSDVQIERYNLEAAEARSEVLRGSLWGEGWQMFTVVFTDTSFTLYQDGELFTYYDACENNTLPEILTDDHVFLIGASSWGGTIGAGGEAFNGQLDDYLIYPRALSDEEIRDIYYAQSGETPDVVTLPPETDAPETEAPATEAPVQTDAPETDAPATDAPEEKSGCGSSMSAAAIVAIVATLGCAVIKKH